MIREEQLNKLEPGDKIWMIRDDMPCELRFSYTRRSSPNTLYVFDFPNMTPIELSATNLLSNYFSTDKEIIIKKCLEMIEMKRIALNQELYCLEEGVRFENYCSGKEKEDEQKSD